VRLFNKKLWCPLATESYSRLPELVRETATIAKLPLVVRVLFVTCIAMFVGNALVLILNLEIVESADSTIVHASPGSDIKLLKPLLMHAATA